MKNRKDIVVAEGYIFEFERRGYLRAGCFVPEVVLSHPDLVRSLHEELVHAGSEVVLAFTVSSDFVFKLEETSESFLLSKVSC